jgi:hypothetical protein
VGRWWIVALVSLVLASSGCSEPEQERSTIVATPQRVRELASIEQLRSTFNEDDSHARIVLLLSPT